MNLNVFLVNLSCLILLQINDCTDVCDSGTYIGDLLVVGQPDLNSRAVLILFRRISLILRNNIYYLH